MIKLTVQYPSVPGSRFDFDYYQTRHLELIRNRLGESCIRLSFSRGLFSVPEGGPPAFIASCDIFFASIEIFQEKFLPNAPEFRADNVNYTDIVPIRQLYEYLSDDF
ncbi:EthD family reductase [Acidovorax sp. SDU_ACID1]|uniref:EthD family reductase n=1 Tax=Acidovorax sp. SDU_ACID1 TaxID=3136632 RepID=UPI003872F3AF